MRNQFLILLAALLAFATSPSVIAAEDGQIVIEDLSVRELRDEIEKIQTEFYRVFNISNADEDLNIVCHEYSPTMSHITEEACEPQFLIDARARNVDNWQRNLEDLLSPEQLRGDQQQGFERLTEAMNELMRNNDYFRELSMILQVLQARLQELEG